MRAQLKFLDFEPGPSTLSGEPDELCRGARMVVGRHSEEANPGATPEAPGGRSRAVPAIVGAALFMLLAGCGSGSGSDAAGGDETSASPAPTSTSPSIRVPTTTPFVKPANGPLIKTEGGTIRGLKTYRRISDYGAIQGYRDDQSFLTFGYGFTDKPSLDAFAKQHQRIVKELHGTELERVDDVVVGGKYNAYHFLDTSDPEEENHSYGLLFLDGSWTIDIGFYNEEIADGVPPLTAEERQKITDSILASFEPTFH